MRLKTKLRVGENPLTDAKGRKFIRAQTLAIAESSLGIIKNNLNRTEEPDPDPRRKHINVKKWSAKVVKQHSIINYNTGKGKSSIVYVVTIRATNYQAPTSYTAYRKPKQGKTYLKLMSGRVEEMSRYAKSVAYNEAEVRKRYKGMSQRYRKYLVTEGSRPIPITRQNMAQIYSDPTKRDMVKTLVAVKVEVSNIAFSRLFSSKNVINPRPDKYNPDNYAKSLKIWRDGKFRYAAHSSPSKHSDSYYYSRVKVIRDGINEMANKNWEIRQYWEKK